MQFTLTLSLTMSMFFALNTAAKPMPAAHCQEWKNGKCANGALSELAHSIKKNGSSIVISEASETCDRVCKEACPKCHLCDLCVFCDMYDEAACHDVPYFENRDTCSIAKTDSCCKLCEVQCSSPEGVCGSKGYCKNKSQTPGTDILTHCVERTTEDQCSPCQGS